MVRVVVSAMSETVISIRFVAVWWQGSRVAAAKGELDREVSRTATE